MLEDLPIPAEFVALATHWHSGLNCKLYAVASTGGLTMGALRPYRLQIGRSYTDQEWHWSLWSDLACDVRHAIRSAKRADHPDAEALKRFEAFAEAEAGRLEAHYGIDI